MNEFRHMLDKMDLHEIEGLKLAKQAITFLEGRKRQLQEQLAQVHEQIGKVRDGTLDPQTVLPSASKQVSDGDGVPRKRRTREGSLSTKILEILTAKGGGPMSVKDISAAVLATGYETESQTFERTVNAALHQMEQTENVGRGLYRLKTASPTPPAAPSFRTRGS